MNNNTNILLRLSTKRCGTCFTCVISFGLMTHLRVGVIQWHLQMKRLRPQGVGDAHLSLARRTKLDWVPEQLGPLALTLSYHLYKWIFPRFFWGSCFSACFKFPKANINLSLRKIICKRRLSLAHKTVGWYLRGSGLCSEDFLCENKASSVRINILLASFFPIPFEKSELYPHYVEGMMLGSRILWQRSLTQFMLLWDSFSR